MNKKITAFALSSCLALGALGQVHISFGYYPPPPPPPRPIYVQPAPVVVAPPAPVVVAPAPVVVEPGPVTVIPEYGYGWYGEAYVPMYNGWFYYNDGWTWGGVGPRPPFCPGWRPNHFHRPPPPHFGPHGGFGPGPGGHGGFGPGPGGHDDHGGPGRGGPGGPGGHGDPGRGGPGGHGRW